MIGVDPEPSRARGLGRALTVAGLASLHDRGIRVGMLFVAADNDAAVGLYRALGFEIHRTDRAYGRRRRVDMTTRYGASRADLDALLAEWGEPRYRADQVYDGLWSPAIPLEEPPRSRRHSGTGSPRHSRSRSSRSRADRATTT